MNEVRIKRVYDEPSVEDGCRILVDRLWPRGVSHEKLPYDHWLKYITPSSEIRTEFGHDPLKFEWFSDAYTQELDENPQGSEFITLIRDCLKSEDVTLLYAAKDPQVNHAMVLKEWTYRQLDEG